MITVIGIMMKPAKTRAADPVARFAVLDSFGSADDEDEEMETVPDNGGD